MATIQLSGNLMTDCGTVYVNGMDLAKILEHAAPGYRELKHGYYLHGDVTITVEVRDETPRT